MVLAPVECFARRVESLSMLGIHIDGIYEPWADSYAFSVSKPAPHWEGTAVVNGEFTELKLTDYKGKYLVFFFYPLDL